jgi:outer membrane protein OmpA-like peptidoglycan-associated protein
VTAQPGSSAPTTIALDADSLTLAPGKASAQLTVQGFPLAAVQPYVPPDLPMTAPTGSIGAIVTVGVEQGDAGLKRLVAAGQVQAEDVSVVPRGRSEPFIKVPQLAIRLTQVDALARTVALDAIEIEGLDAHAQRDANGNIDVLGFFSSAAPAVEIVKSRTGLSAEPPPAAMPAAPSQATPAPPSQTGSEWRVTLERFKLSKGTVAFEDQQVSPATRFALEGVEVTADHVAWPLTKPATFTFLALMPGGGWSYAKGTAALAPLNVQVAISTRETPIMPYQPYFPFPARFEGLFNGDSLSEIQRGPQGELILASRGTAWSNEPKVLAPGATDPVASAEAVVISDIDFSWPNYALVQRVTFVKPRALIEREADGTINLRTLFTPAKKDKGNSDTDPSTASKEPKASTPSSGASGPAAPAAQPEAAPAQAATHGGDGGVDEGGLMQNMVLDFTDIAIENGQATFVDRTTTPAFSEQVSRLALTIHDLSNVLGRPNRTTLTAQALIGVDGALDMRGDLSGLGETLRADLVAELRDFSLPGTSPYTENLMSWNVRSGTLRAKIHYQVQGDRITAQHELEFKKLKVEKARESDDAKRRIGVPLGLAVALLKDSDGNIDLSFPLNGSLSDRQFDWGEAMWAAVKQVITKVVLAPFHAIGRLFKGSDDSVDALEIEPVTFAPGSAVIAPSLEAQLTRLAEFLRRSPSIKVALAPIVTAADVEKLNEQVVTSRLEAYRREHSLPDLAGALAAYYKQRAPDAVRPNTVDEQIALLARREPAPDAATADLARRRVEAVREDLVAARSIEAERVVTPAPAAEVAAASGEGRVEFNIVTDAK